MTTADNRLESICGEAQEADLFENDKLQQQHQTPSLGSCFKKKTEDDNIEMVSLRKWVEENL